MQCVSVSEVTGPKVTGPKVTGPKVTEEKSQKKSHRTESLRKKVKTCSVGRGGDRGRGQGVGV